MLRLASLHRYQVYLIHLVQVYLIHLVHRRRMTRQLIDDRRRRSLPDCWKKQPLFRAVSLKGREDVTVLLLSGWKRRRGRGEGLGSAIWCSISSSLGDSIGSQLQPLLARAWPCGCGCISCGGDYGALACQSNRPWWVCSNGRSQMLID